MVLVIGSCIMAVVNLIQMDKESLDPNNPLFIGTLLFILITAIVTLWITSRKDSNNNNKAMMGIIEGQLKATNSMTSAIEHMSESVDRLQESIKDLRNKVDK